MQNERKNYVELKRRQKEVQVYEDRWIDIKYLFMIFRKTNIKSFYGFILKCLLETHNEMIITLGPQDNIFNNP